MGIFSKAKPKPKRIVLRTGDDLVCTVCGFDLFFERKAQLNTSTATFLNLDWTNPTADCCVCGRCGHVLWFLA